MDVLERPLDLSVTNEVITISDDEDGELNIFINSIFY